MLNPARSANGKSTKVWFAWWGRLPQPVDPVDPLCWRLYEKGQKYGRGQEDGASPSGGSLQLGVKLQYLLFLLKLTFQASFGSHCPTLNWLLQIVWAHRWLSEVYLLTFNPRLFDDKASCCVSFRLLIQATRSSASSLLSWPSFLFLASSPFSVENPEHFWSKAAFYKSPIHVRVFSLTFI